MLSITSRLNFTRTLGSMMMLGIMLFLCITYVYAGQVSLAWNANTESTLGGYQLHYGQTSGNYTANVDVGNQTSYTLTGLNNGATYYFAAKAYNSGKTTFSGFSNEVSTTTASAPTASFTATPTSGTAPLTVTFTGASTGSITTRSWNFGDGTTSTATSAAKTYTNPGTYTVTLTVTGPGGSNTATKSILAIAAPPVANFTATRTSGTAPLAVPFIDTSTGSITARSWNFGDGSTSTTQNPAHTYSTAGTYTVSLTATGPGGTNTKTQSGYVTVSSVTGGGSPAGLVATYNFEEASGTTVVDASGKGNNGTLSGATRITQGRFGKALSFNGNGNVVTIKDAPSLDLTTGMTVEAWVYPINPSANWTPWHPVVMKAGSTNTSGSTYGAAAYGVYASSDTDQAATGVFTNGSWVEYLNGGPTLATNTWTHIVSTYNGATQRLYINGQEVANSPLTGAIQVSDGVLYIGGAPFWGEYFQGYIDQVRIYNRALTAAEIRGNTGLVAAYNFEEASGTTVVDASGKGNNGTLSGATRITQGRFGKALSFNGNGNVVTIKDAPSLDLATGMTVEAWVYPINPSANWTPWHPVVMKAGSTTYTSGGAYGAAAYDLYASTNTDQAATGVFTNGSWVERLNGGPTLATNTWTHIVGTYNGATQRLYINGTEVANSPLTGAIQVSDGVLYIGGAPFWGEYFQGYIDQVRIYNRALTAAEVQSAHGDDSRFSVPSSP